MKDEISIVKKIKPTPPLISVPPVYITWIKNDPQERLDFTMCDSSVPDKKSIVPRKFYYQVNGGDITPLIFFKRDIVYGPMPSDVEGIPPGSGALYQFNISYEALEEGSNTITFFEETADFADTTSIPELPVKGLPQDDGTSVQLYIFNPSVTLKAYPEKNLTNVQLERPGIEETSDKILWRAIKNHCLKFTDYEQFIDVILDRDYPPGGKDLPSGSKGFNRHGTKMRSPFVKSEEYNLIKFATEYYMLRRFGLSETELIGYVGSSGKLPYYDFVIDRIRDEIKFDSLSGNYEGGDDDDRREEQRLFNPFMTELIWSYWMEQGMLVQTMNVINLRFQNVRTDVYSDRLQRFDADPLRPMSYILWGYIQDEQHRLSLPRRVNEYDHEYGLLLTGRAVNKLNSVDSRVKFLEAFHNLLNLAFIYFKESDDTTYIADAFPVLNALREVHLLLAEGNHNAYGNLTWTARQEMLLQQYILARPEMREFLGGRVMVPYPEAWMDRVDTMRNIQGWGETSILHYYELAIHGEQIILSIRYGNWSDVTLDRTNAANWAQEFRNNIYRYIHAYRVVTGVDLTIDKIQSNSNYAIQPSYLIMQRLQLSDRGTGFMQKQRLLSAKGKDRRL